MTIAMPEIRVLAQRLMWALLAIHVLSFATNFLHHGLGVGRKVHVAVWLATFFNVDEHQNLPTWFSSVILLLTAWILWEVAAAAGAAGQHRYVRHWRILSVVFALLSLDDMTEAHRVLRTGPLATIGNASSWMLILAPVALVFAISYLRFLFHLPPRTRWSMLAAAAAYGAGVTAVEVAGAVTGRNLLAHLPGEDLTGAAYVRYLLAASAEELIQGLAVIAFLFAMGSCLQRYQDLAAVTAPPVQAGGRGGRPAVVTPSRRLHREG
ncbi:hypothetical protein [Catellatospora sichuanensis]|uniref:hypothetical protein n=1 Tax=Catellatospora sichuanensis TaxID=1969805 RepID=UPI00118429F4|nr:hypothetical protein [Catellatospora sichuanensis]